MNLFLAESLELDCYIPGKVLIQAFSIEEAQILIDKMIEEVYDPKIDDNPLDVKYNIRELKNKKNSIITFI